MVVTKTKGAVVEKQQRERSAIAFPYVDLEDALGVASAIHKNAGSQCSWDQLAAYLKHGSANSGAFRLKVGAARLFGLVETSRNAVALTELGQDVVDPLKSLRAKDDAFLRVPLYKEIFNRYRGRMLPPDVGLERELRELGVPTKQVAKARQVFQRSAEVAGYFAQGKDRLVRPAGLTTKEIERAAPSRFPTTAAATDNVGGASGGGGGGGMHPFIQGLLQTLPVAGAEWSREQRQQWLGTAEHVFNLMYKEPTSATHQK